MNRSPFPPAAFTLIEMLVVMSIIAILVGLVLSISGLVQKKQGLARAESEIQALSAACENYKADNAVYPQSTDTDNLDARTNGNPATYSKASGYLLATLSGDTNLDGKIAANEGKNYAPEFFKPNRIGGKDVTTKGVTTNSYIMDPFGFSYGYSTAYQADLAKDPSKTPTRGYNPTFDLWSTAGKTSNPTPGAATDVTNVWLKNW